MSLLKENIDNILYIDDDIHKKIDLINKLSSELSSELLSEHILKIINMYDTDQISSTYELLSDIIIKTNIDINLKYECVNAIYRNSPSLNNNGLYLVKTILDEYKNGKRTITNDNFSTNIKVSLYKLLLDQDPKNFINNEKETVETLYLLPFIKLILNTKSDIEYRFKIIIDFEKLKINNMIQIIIDNSYLYLFESKYENSDRQLRYVILIVQYMLNRSNQKSTIFTDKIIQSCIDKCLDIANDEKLLVNTRADAADVLIHNVPLDINGRTSANVETTIAAGGCDNCKYREEIKKKAIDIITRLGKIKSENKSIYGNSQNVHTAEIEKSVSDYILKVLGPITLKENAWNDMNKKIQEKKFQDKEKILSSLFRIDIDKTIYPGGQTLKTILTKIWHLVETVIEKEKIVKGQEEKKHVLISRVFEELSEADGTCSSGFVTRIVNIMSCYGFQLDIGFKNQIKANVIARLNKLISNDKDRDIILSEMTDKHFIKDNSEAITDFGCDTDSMDNSAGAKAKGENIKSENRVVNNRKNFDNFLKLKVPIIYDEMYLEFVGKRETTPSFTAYKGLYVSHDDFDIWFRDALGTFECVD